MEKIKSIYVDWSSPSLSRGRLNLSKEDWEISLIHRSSFFSREINGFSPVLYCDPITREYYEFTGISKCFDEVIDILPVGKEYNPGVFWAAGKFIAIKHCNSPFILMDLDLEIRKKIDLSTSEVFCSHLELIKDGNHEFYPDPLLLDKKGYFKNNGISFTDKALNTSLLYFKDIGIAKEYADLALGYINSSPEINPLFYNSSYILLAEQRLLYEFCSKEGIPVETLISGHFLSEGSSSTINPHSFVNSNISEVSEYFLHIWGYKKDLKDDPKLSKDLYERLTFSCPEWMRNPIIESCNLNSEYQVKVSNYK
jgi:hypothetical protein